MNILRSLVTTEKRLRPGAGRDTAKSDGIVLPVDLTRQSGVVRTLRGIAGGVNNGAVQNDWQKRIDRAEELAETYAFAVEVLRFYALIARFQAGLHSQLSNELGNDFWAGKCTLATTVHPFAQSRFADFLDLLKGKAPGKVAERARNLHNSPREVGEDLLNKYWMGAHPQRQEVDEFLARGFLQPYAEFVRSHTDLVPQKHTSMLCPFCGRRPGVGVLRQLGEGGQRSLVCSFCLAEWTFRRILCPGCGEEDHKKLSVFTAAELDHVRVDGCDSCKTYIKTVDLTRNGLAEPVVDEIAAMPLDLWAQERGYTKLQSNLMQM